MTNAIRTTSPATEYCAALHVTDGLFPDIPPGDPYVITWTGQADQVRRWHPACVPAGLVSRWLALPASFVDTVRIGEEATL